MGSSVCGGGNNVTFSLRLGVCVCLLVLPFHLTLPSMWVVLQWNWFPLAGAVGELRLGRFGFEVGQPMPF